MTRHDIQLEDIPEWPVVRIGLQPDPTTGTPALTIAGNPVNVPAGQDPRRYAITAAAAQAKMLGRPIRVIASEGTNEWPLIIYPDGGITDPNAVGAREKPGWRMPAGLGLGIAGLVLLAGLAASVFVIGPTALHSSAAPPPASSPPAHTTPAAPPPPRTQHSAPPPTSAPAISTPPHPAAPSSPSTTRSRPPTITFAPPVTPATPSAAQSSSQPPPPRPRSTPGTPTAPRTHEQLAPPTRPAPKTTSTSTTTPSPSTSSTSQAPTPDGPAIRGPVRVGDYCLAGFIGVAIAERCAADTSEQTWTFRDGQLAQPDGCLTVSDRRAILARCTAGDDAQRWNRSGDGQLHNIGTNTCLIPASNDSDTVTVSAVTCSN
jgi:ricin-type beta-trefoil lectin protein